MLRLRNRQWDARNGKGPKARCIPVPWALQLFRRNQYRWSCCGRVALQTLYHIENVIIELLSFLSKPFSPTMSKSPSMARKRMSRREADIISLHKEREKNMFPLTKPPFLRTETWPAAEQKFEEFEEIEEIKIEQGELLCKAPYEVLWIDLLLEISMATAFASLTDETPVLQWDNAISYLCFFAFVWWIWVAQVAYNMRFRQADLLHRVWALLQLLVFGALSAFTREFDVTFGLTGNDPTEALREQLMIELGSDSGRLAAETFRNNRLPRVNARGISMVLALSRLLLLAQYLVVFIHAKGLKRTSILVHIGTLMFSSLCFFGAFFALGFNGQDDFATPIPALEIAKLVLWFLPIVVEMLSYLVALRFPGFVRYSTESISTSNGTMFVVILGCGLDKMTSGFSDFVGNIGLKVNAIPMFLATATVFLCLFFLYFSIPGSKKTLSNRRAWVWLMSQGLFLGPMLITLQAIAQSLKFSNLLNAVHMGASSLTPIFDQMRDYPDMNVTAEMFPYTQIIFDKMGASLPVVIENANRALAYQKDYNLSISTNELQQNMDVVYCILDMLNALPDVGSLLWAKANIFLTAGMTNSTELTEANYNDIWSGIIMDRGSSELWLFPAAGASVLTLVFMCFVRGTPRDKWEWIIICVRFTFGIGICLLALLDIGGGNSPITASSMPSGSKIWTLLLGQTQWPLIILAVALVTERVLEHIIALAANKTYLSMPDILGPQAPARSRTQEYQRTARHDRDLLTSDDDHYSFTGRRSTDPLYDPFDAHDTLEDGQVSRHTTAPSGEGDHNDRTLHDDEYSLTPSANVAGGN
ncbi:hypothetical protein FIBSPDRAFT_1038164 [Athelia psychrophila]|uniref:Low temperature requirement A n=1 Tax=Athelia psychrophila TaxID=1759441 RepID=A0A166TDB1_9AGAM|nr:hypothetical protein FIBSPDRAFT_1038164 [Fibularhizoctonia sp. CBS 109695]